MATKREAKDDVVVHGATNVFADLGYKHADARQTKLRLAYEINRILARRKLNTCAAVDFLGISPPKVSALSRYKLEEFSFVGLMTFLTALGRDVEIAIRRKPRSLPTGRISVVAPR